MAKIKVYRKDTGEIVRVPEHFMDHPVLGAPFRKTPSQKSRDLVNAEKQAEADAQAALKAEQAATKTSTPRAGEAANPTNTDESAKADAKKE